FLDLPTEFVRLLLTVFALLVALKFHGTNLRPRPVNLALVKVLCETPDGGRAGYQRGQNGTGDGNDFPPFRHPREPSSHCLVRQITTTTTVSTSIVTTKVVTTTFLHRQVRIP